jgi:hypothetical protein
MDTRTRHTAQLQLKGAPWFALRASRLYEQGDGIHRLRLYVIRWTRWLRGGLPGMVSVKGGITHYFVFVIKQLQIKGLILKKVNPAIL